MDQGTFYLNKTAISLPDMAIEALQSFTTAAQATKKSITNSYISRKPIEFYIKNIFQQSSMLSEYNFYNETNINKLKLFIENFLNEIGKSPPPTSKETFGYHPDMNNSLVSNYKSIEGKNIPMTTAIAEQMNELKYCLKHFTKSLSEINQAEFEYMESLEKTNLSKFTQKFKVNKQALFQESENLIAFTNTLVQHLDTLNLNISQATKVPDNTADLSVTDLEIKEEKKVQDEATQTQSSPILKPQPEKSILSKDTSAVTTPKKLSSEVVSLLEEESLYSTGIQKAGNTVNHGKRIESQVSSIHYEGPGQQEGAFSLNDVQNARVSTQNDIDDKIDQLLQLNKMLGAELEMKDENLKFTKKNYLREVQDSNNLRVQLTSMIEDNIELKEKLEEALSLNDEFES